ncbi:MAG: LEPR-XLL domain-containing protein, partial [Rhodoferax sp.]|nr:LEPR-XLL domain-containing protein [Rhodoferax sp.]
MHPASKSPRLDNREPPLRNRLASWITQTFGGGLTTGTRGRPARRGTLEFENLEARVLLSDTPLYTAALAAGPVD